MKLLDFYKSINHSKENLFNKDEKAAKIYQPFIVNKNFSFYVDTILYANEMNCKWELDRQMQYDFLRFAIRKKKRFCEWNKKQKNDDIELIKEAYHYNNAKAQEVLNILGPGELDKIRESIYKGDNCNKE